jgi:hypothetical protein
VNTDGDLNAMDRSARFSQGANARQKAQSVCDEADPKFVQTRAWHTRPDRVRVVEFPHVGECDDPTRITRLLT